jgi:hypothetical protein
VRYLLRRIPEAPDEYGPNTFYPIVARCFHPGDEAVRSTIAALVLRMRTQAIEASVNFSISATGNDGEDGEGGDDWRITVEGTISLTNTATMEIDTEGRLYEQGGPGHSSVGIPEIDVFAAGTIENLSTEEVYGLQPNVGSPTSISFATQAIVFFMGIVEPGDPEQPCMSVGLQALIEGQVFVQTESADISAHVLGFQLGTPLEGSTVMGLPLDFPIITDGAPTPLPLYGTPVGDWIPTTDGALLVNIFGNPVLFAGTLTASPGTIRVFGSQFWRHGVDPDNHTATTPLNALWGADGSPVASKETILRAKLGAA